MERKQTALLLGLIGLAGVGYYLYGSKITETSTPEQNLPKIKNLWRQTGEVLWEKIKGAISQAKAQVGGATFEFAYKDMENQQYKEYYCCTSTTTQLLLINYWQTSFGVDFQPVLDSVKDQIGDIIQGQLAFNITADITATALSAVGAQTFSNLLSVVVNPKNAIKLLPGALMSSPIGWLFVIGTAFIPNPLANLWKPKFKGKVEFPFPTNTLKVLKYLTCQNAEYLFACEDFQYKDKGYFVVSRLIELEETKQGMATPFYANKFIEGCRLLGYTSLYDKMVYLNNTIQEIEYQYPAFHIPYNLTYDNLPLKIDDSLEIIQVNSDQYKRLWEQLTGRKWGEKIEVPVDVVLSERINPDTLLPDYRDLLYQLPYRPLLAYPDYPEKIIVKCPVCNGKGYIIREKSGVFGIHPKVIFSTCPKCNGFGFILVGL